MIIFYFITIAVQHNAEMKFPLPLTILALVKASALAFTFDTHRRKCNPNLGTALRAGIDNVGEITALARIDRDFQLTTRSSNRPTGGQAGWTKLMLESDENGSDSFEGAQKEFVYLLEPPTSPSSVILFLYRILFL